MRRARWLALGLALAGCARPAAMTDEPPDSNGRADSAPPDAGDRCDDPVACPALRFAPNGRVLPVEHLSLTVGLGDDANDAVFEVQWTYDDPAVADDSEELVGELRVPRAELDTVGDEPVVYRFATEQRPLRITDCLHRIHGIAVVETPLAPTTGALSVRREARDLVAGMSLEFAPTNGPATTQAAGTDRVSLEP
jgi:hypothetical protein